LIAVTLLLSEDVDQQDRRDNEQAQRQGIDRSLNGTAMPQPR